MTPSTDIFLDPGSSGTGLSDAVRHQNATSQAQVDDYNMKLRLSFMQRWADYTTNMQSGQIIPPERRLAPVVPNAWQLSAPDGWGFQYPEVGSNPVMDQPPMPYYAGGNPQPNKEKNVFLIGKRSADTLWFSALPGDTFPSGLDTPPGATSADGVVGTFTKFGGAILGWYLLKLNGPGTLPTI